jgi:hypothetical protein
MLGIDIASQSIRIVNLRRRGGHFQMQEPLELPLETESFSDPIALGKDLRAALEGRGWQSQKAVLTLPRRLCFVRRFATDALQTATGSQEGTLARSTMDSLLHMTRDSLLVSADQLVFDLWSGAAVWKGKGEEGFKERMVLLGAAQKNSVEFYQEMAEAAGLKSPALELRSLAAINGLLFHWHEAQEDHIAVVYVDHLFADVAFLDSEGLVTLQSLGISEGGNGGGLGNHDLVQQLQQAFNAIKLTDPNYIPKRLFLALSDDTAGWEVSSLAEKLARRLKIEVTVCSVCDHPLLQMKKSEGGFLPRNIPALGAALDGLAVSPTWFDFFHPRGVSTEKKRHVSWKPFVFLLVIIFILLMGFWGSLVQQKLHHLNEIQKQIKSKEPELNRICDSRDSWNLFRTYIPAGQSGNRLEIFNSFYEISNLCPDPNDAYVNELAITGKDGMYTVKISGNVREDKIVTNFIATLNNSKMFREAKQEGPIMTLTAPENPFYPLSFSITCQITKSQAAKP